MGDFTYQAGETSAPLETYEWDRTWIEHTENTAAKRVFYIGDSISWGIRPEAQKAVGAEICIDAFATSKALDNPFFLPSLRLFFQQVRKPDFVLVNNGLHGWHLGDGEEYPTLLKSFLLALKEGLEVPVGVVLTTCVKDSSRNIRVIARNDAARAVAEELGCPVLDFYTASLNCTHTDGVHFNGDGYRSLADVLVARIRTLL